MDLMLLMKLENETGFIGPDFAKHYPELAIPFTIVICISIFSGVIGNPLVIAAVITTKELHSPVNYFIVNLALADLGISVISGSMSLVGIFAGEIFFLQRAVLCEFVAAFCLVACFSSLVNFALIGLNRYLCIVHPPWFRRVYTNISTLIMCFAVWLVGIIFDFPGIFGWSGHAFDRKALLCLWDRMASKSHRIFLALVPVGVPLLITSVFYVGIFIHVKKSANRVANHSKPNQNDAENRSSKSSARVAKTTFMIFFVYLLCWTPYTVNFLADEGDTFPIVVHGSFLLLAHLNSSLNFIILSYTSIIYRRAFFRLLGLRYCVGDIVFDGETTTPSRTGNSRGLNRG